VRLTSLAGLDTVGVRPGEKVRYVELMSVWAQVITNQGLWMEIVRVCVYVCLCVCARVCMCLCGWVWTWHMLVGGVIPGLTLSQPD